MIEQVPYNWYVAYTYPKAEKEARRIFEKMGIESFLPLQKVFKNWSDRKKIVELPLFPNYIFIYTTARDLYKPLQCRKLIKYIYFSGKPAVVHSSVIETLKRIIEADVSVSNEDFLVQGMPITIASGPFKGIEGKLIKRNGKTRLLIQIESLSRSVSMELPACMVIPGPNQEYLKTV